MQRVQVRGGMWSFLPWSTYGALRKYGNTGCIFCDDSEAEGLGMWTVTHLLKSCTHDELAGMRKCMWQEVVRVAMVTGLAGAYMVQHTTTQLCRAICSLSWWERRCLTALSTWGWKVGEPAELRADVGLVVAVASWKVVLVSALLKLPLSYDATRRRRAAQGVAIVVYRQMTVGSYDARRRAA